MYVFGRVPQKIVGQTVRLYALLLKSMRHSRPLSSPLRRRSRQFSLPYKPLSAEGTTSIPHANSYSVDFFCIALVQ